MATLADVNLTTWEAYFVIHDKFAIKSAPWVP